MFFKDDFDHDASALRLTCPKKTLDIIYARCSLHGAHIIGCEERTATFLGSTLSAMRGGGKSTTISFEVGS